MYTTNTFTLWIWTHSFTLKWWLPPFDYKHRFCLILIDHFFFSLKRVSGNGHCIVFSLLSVTVLFIISTIILLQDSFIEKFSFLVWLSRFIPKNNQCKGNNSIQQFLYRILCDGVKRLKNHLLKTIQLNYLFVFFNRPT